MSAMPHAEWLDLTVDDINAAIEAEHPSLSVLDKMILREKCMRRLVANAEVIVCDDNSRTDDGPNPRSALPVPQRAPAPIAPAEGSRPEPGASVQRVGFSHVGRLVRYERAFNTEWAVVEWSNSPYTHREIPSSLVPMPERPRRQRVVDVHLPEVS